MSNGSTYKMNGLTIAISHNLINQLLNRDPVLALERPTTLADSNQSAMMNIMHNDNTFPLNIHIELYLCMAVSSSSIASTMNFSSFTAS